MKFKRQRHTIRETERGRREREVVCVCGCAGGGGGGRQTDESNEEGREEGKQSLYFFNIKNDILKERVRMCV